MSSLNKIEGFDKILEFFFREIKTIYDWPREKISDEVTHKEVIEIFKRYKDKYNFLLERDNNTNKFKGSFKNGDFVKINSEMPLWKCHFRKNKFAKIIKVSIACQDTGKFPFHYALLIRENDVIWEYGAWYDHCDLEKVHDQEILEILKKESEGINE